MKFNVGKCKIMHMGHNNPHYTYFMNGERLAVVEEEIDMGVTVQTNMKPNKQSQKAANTAMSVLWTIQRNFHYRNKTVYMKLYKQYVRPHLKFAVPAWSP
jgi:hypothetical protein